MEKSVEKLGEGASGCIYFLQSTTEATTENTINNMCFKVSTLKNIKEEFFNIKLLPKLDIFYNTELVKIEIVSEDEEDFYIKNCDAINSSLDLNNTSSEKINEYIRYIQVLEQNNKSFILFRIKEHLNLELYNMKNTDNYLCKLYMPFIKGKTFDFFLEKYFCDNKIIKLNKFVKNSKLVLHLYDQVWILNSKYNIYHNDIHGRNIIVSETNIYLIDFEQVNFYNNIDQNSNIYSDLENIEPLIKSLIFIGSYNDKIKLLLIKYKLIDKDFEGTNEDISNENLYENFKNMIDSLF